MSEFVRDAKFKIGDLVSVMMPDFKNCGPMLGIIVEVRLSIITKNALYLVHLPTGKVGAAFEKDLEFANA
jgi:hypothetical protein